MSAFTCPIDRDCSTVTDEPCGDTCVLKRPMMGCGYVDHDDGTCTHPLNFTPECHQDIRCPVLELRAPVGCLGCLIDGMDHSCGYNVFSELEFGGRA